MNKSGYAHQEIEIGTPEFEAKLDGNKTFEIVPRSMHPSHGMKIKYVEVNRYGVRTGRFLVSMVTYLDLFNPLLVDGVVIYSEQILAQGGHVL